MTDDELRKACEALAEDIADLCGRAGAPQMRRDILLRFAKQQQAVGVRMAKDYLNNEAVRFDNIDDGEAYMVRQFAVRCEAKAKELETK